MWYRNWNDFLLKKKLLTFEKVYKKTKEIHFIWNIWNFFILHIYLKLYRYLLVFIPSITFPFQFSPLNFRSYRKVLNLPSWIFNINSFLRGTFSANLIQIVSRKFESILAADAGKEKKYILTFPKHPAAVQETKRAAPTWRCRTFYRTKRIKLSASDNLWRFDASRHVGGSPTGKVSCLAAVVRRVH